MIKFLHNLTKTKLGSNVLYLHECWALGEFERQLVLPPEIAEGKAGTVIIDKDEFEDHGLTGDTT